MITALIILISSAVCAYAITKNRTEVRNSYEARYAAKSAALKEIAYGDFDRGLKMLARYNAEQDRRAGVVCDCEHCKDNA